MKGLAIGLAAAAFALWGGLAQAATPCALLTAAALPHAQVTSAVEAPIGTGLACKVDVTSRPSADSDIRIEVWLPEGAAWNGRYVQLGNGGFAGQISSRGLQAMATEGYAVAMTDDGHQSRDGTDGSWAIGHPEKVIDFGWRALKETTIDAKALIRAYEGASARYAYFDGCSDGGREALMEAQRFPDDFDGIVAGAPAYNLTGLLTLAAHDVQALSKPGGYLDADALKTLETGALKACADGGTYVQTPADCQFDPATVACPASQPAAGCLTSGEVATARAIYDGMTGSGPIYPGHSPGAEAERDAWGVWITGPSQDQMMNQALIARFARGFWGGFVFGDANYDVTRLDIGKAQAAATKVAREVDATDPDLTRFRAHGGKLIHYHGWNDPAIPSAGSVVYYEDVRKRMGDVSDFYRLYLIPGMLDCGGGPGPSSVDWLGDIRAWVEQRKAPGGLIATSSPGAPPAAQAICPYWATGSIEGSGEQTRVECVEVSLIRAPPPPPR